METIASETNKQTMIVRNKHKNFPDYFSQNIPK